MKTEFELDFANGNFRGEITIIGLSPENKPYLSIAIRQRDNSLSSVQAVLPDYFYEMLAMNMLRSIESKRLKDEYHLKKRLIKKKF